MESSADNQFMITSTTTANQGLQDLLNLSSSYEASSSWPSPSADASSSFLTPNETKHAIFYHIIDHVFGIQGSNNNHSYSYSRWNQNITRGPPHSFPLILGSEEATPLSWRRIGWTLEDSCIVLFAALVLFLLRFALNKSSLKNFLCQYLSASSLARLKTSANPETFMKKLQQRVMENVWFSLYYSASAIFGIIILYDAPWFWDLSHLVMGYPEEQTGYEISSFARLYLLLGAAFYFQALFSLLFIDERMKDFVEMLIHHIVTIVLIVWCVISYYHRIGTLVLLLHDVVDVFLYIAKTLNHLKFERTCETVFVGFVLSFFVLRLIYLPYLIIHSLFYTFNSWDYPQRYYVFRYVTNVHDYFEISSYGACCLKYCVSSFWSLIALLVVLVLLHIFWFSLVTKMIVNIVSGKGKQDIRENDD
ncbi:hypothetical protein C9374_005326 [Naegleria lovaniensis]|uniref:TLC domain-containing protein n=1 Tax=Naegleria lovaniensis TaxID=51637 RepID=A0AA88KNM2_NAELO|nr:uncharacterized protein C9374_005326 [Naegleria lovaniensis]KAG2382746.1 hypothetical protein C9374_005326 [Naegleria lovaniensis]